MKRAFLYKFMLALFIGFASVTVSFAQGTYGATRYFNWTYDSLSAAEKTAFTGGATVNTVVDGDALIFGGANSTGPTRSKGGYVGAVRCQYIDLPEYASLGYLSFYVQNGSSGTDRKLYIKISTDNGATWLTTDTILVTGSADQRISPTSVLSKKTVKVRIDSEGQVFWFHQVEAWSSTLASVNPTEAPAILSITPVGGSTISASGSVDLQFDEIVKIGTGAVTFSGGAVNPLYKGSLLRVKYAGLSSATNTLTIPAVFVNNTENINMAKDTSIIYNMDLTDPVYQSVSPVDGSNIVINDVLQKIILTFDEPIALGTGTITFGPATVTPSISGNTLVIGYSGLAYSTPYTLTIPANFVTDISGNTYNPVITLNYTTLPPDGTPPTLSSQSVADAETNVPIGGSIYFTFDENVELGTGNVTINATPVTLSFNGAMVGINYTNFNYNTVYTVTIPSGAITDTTGNAYAGTTFSFTTNAFATKAFDIIVAKDGSGDYTTIQAAVNAVPDLASQRTFVYVKNGTYTEKVLIPATKQNLSLIGQDSAYTILTYNDYAGAPGLSTDLSYTINVKAPGFYAENITIKNTYGAGSQAVALMTEGDRQVFKNCRATGFQDTHYPKQPNTRSYYLNCYIEGATDFMFGSGTVVFESSRINCVSGGQYMTAPSGTTKEFGLVYNNCTLTANSNVAAQAFYLGRPWKDFGKTVWLNTKMGTHVKDIGWAVWTTTGADADNHLTGFFAEYNSMDLAGTPINPTRAAWGVKLTAGQAARYTIDNIFNYGSGSNTWNPLPFSTAPAAPANLVENSNVLTWDASTFAVGYVVFRNGVMIGTTTATTYNDASAPAGTNDYKVKAVNEYGAQSASTPGTVSAIDPGYFNREGIQLYPNPFADIVTIQNSEKVKTIEFFDEEGRMVKQMEAAPSIKTSDLKTGYYILKLTAKNGASYSIKMIKR